MLYHYVTVLNNEHPKERDRPYSLFFNNALYRTLDTQDFEHMNKKIWGSNPPLNIEEEAGYQPVWMTH